MLLSLLFMWKNITIEEPLKWRRKGLKTR